MQHESPEFAAAADDRVDDKAREQLTQGTCHQENTGLEEEGLELAYGISIFD